MAKLVYACVRDIANAPSIKNRIESIIDKLVPDNIPDAKCKVVDHGEIIYGISTYTPSIAEQEDGVCMGMVYDNPGQWWKPMADHPEGSYAIFRADDDYVEAITDVACSRAVWYYKDEIVFLEYMQNTTYAYKVITYHVMSYHIMTCHVISYHVMSSYVL